MQARHLVFLAVLLAGCSSSSQPEPFWVGHLAPLSGSDRDQGDQAVAAMNHALQQAREAEFTVAGRPLGVRHADAARGTVRAEAVRLLTVNRVAALVLGPGVASPEEVLAVCRRQAVPILVLDELVDVPSPHSGAVLLAADPARRGAALADFARHELKLSRAAVLVCENRPLCAALTEAFVRTWRMDKGEVRQWKPDDLRQKSQVAEFTRWKPELILLAVGPDRPTGLADTLIGLAAQTVVLYGGEDRDGTPLPWLDRGGKDGPTIYTASAYSRAARLPKESQQLLDELAKSQGSKPGRTAVLALDAIRLLRERPELLRELDRTRDVQKRLELLSEQAFPEEFESVTGTMFWKEGRPIRPLFLVRYRSGKETLIRQTQAKR